MKHARQKVLLITNIPTPYRIPLFNRLAQEGDIELRVLFLSVTEQNRQWQSLTEQAKFDYQVLGGIHSFLKQWELPVHLNRGVFKAIHKFAPSVVISGGYDSLAYWQAAVYCHAFRKRFILWNGTTLLSTRSSSGPLGWLKRRFVSSADTYVSYGTQAAKYLEALGASSDRICVGVNTVDMEWFRESIESYRNAPDFQMRRSRYPELLVLYSGQLIARKGVSVILEALHIIGDSDIGLLIVGSGPQEQALHRMCDEWGLKNVYFEGFQDYNDLPRYYSLADVTVLPSSEEVWGLVVNESLAGGIFVLCSDRAGVGFDLIKPGWNGTSFPASDVDRLVTLLLNVKENIDDIHSRRETIREHACQEFGIERSAQAFLKAIELAKI